MRNTRIYEQLFAVLTGFRKYFVVLKTGYEMCSVKCTFTMISEEGNSSYCSQRKFK